ncbi:MAG: sigma-70 family RNA polymerase sigma factor [Planctomycetota bacterium]
MEFPDTRATLLLRLRDPRDAEAWSTFESLYAGVITAVARRRGLQAADAEDIAQDVFTRIAGYAQKIRGTHPDAQFRTFVHRLIRQSIIDRHRREARHSPGITETDDWEARSVDCKTRSVDSETRNARSGTRNAPLRHRETLDSICIQQIDDSIDWHYRRETFRWAAKLVQREFRAQSWNAFAETALKGRDPAAVAKELNMSVGAIYIARSRVLQRLRERVQQIDPDFSPPEESSP